jgi:hypothetical protein
MVTLFIISLLFTLPPKIKDFWRDLTIRLAIEDGGRDGGLLISK